MARQYSENFLAVVAVIGIAALSAILLEISARNDGAWKAECVQQAIAASRPAEDVLKICGAPR